MAKIGRPPNAGEKRTKLVPFYLTETHQEALKDFATKGGFKSTSSLVTALLEPMIDGRLSIKSAATAVNRVQAFMQKHGTVKFGASIKEVGQELLSLFGAPVPLIPDDVQDLSQLKQDLRNLLDELEKQEPTT